MKERQECRVPAKAVREISMEKGKDFTAKYVNEFSREWDRTIRLLKGCGKSLDAIPIVRK